MCSTWPRPSSVEKFRSTQFDDTWDDQTITQALTAVKGIGVWTAEMFLIFVMNRPDVLAGGRSGSAGRTAGPARPGRAAGTPRLPRPGRAMAAVPHRSRAGTSGGASTRPSRRPATESPNRQIQSRRTRAVAERSHDARRTESERAMMFDLILKGGWVIDGSGGPPFRADVAMLETMIADVGRLDGAQRTACHRRRGSLRRSRVHRRSRPRRPHAPGRPDPPSGLAPGGDDLSHRPGRQLVRAGLRRRRSTT